MADNTQLGAAESTGDKVVTFEVTFSGDSGSKLQGVGLFGVTGSNESWTINPINGTTANGLYCDVRVIQAGTNAIGNVGLIPRTTGGATAFRNIDADENGTVLKNAAGQLFWLYAANLTASVLYLKLYNKATTPNTSDTPMLTIPIFTPGSTNGGGVVLQIPTGVPFSSGISYRVTTGLADNDGNGPASNGCILAGGYA